MPQCTKRTLVPYQAPGASGRPQCPNERVPGYTMCRVHLNHMAARNYVEETRAAIHKRRRELDAI